MAPIPTEERDEPITGWRIWNISNDVRTTAVAARGLGRRSVGADARRRGALRRAVDAVAGHPPARRAVPRLHVRHLREPVARRLRATAAGVAAAVRGRHGVPVGDRDRARTGMAGTVRVSRQARPRVLDVCLVRARTGGAVGRPRVLGLSLRVVRDASRRHPGAGRTPDPTRRSRSEGAAGQAPRRLRGRSGADRLGPDRSSRSRGRPIRPPISPRSAWSRRPTAPESA